MKMTRLWPAPRQTDDVHGRKVMVAFTAIALATLSSCAAQTRLVSSVSPETQQQLRVDHVAVVDPLSGTIQQDMSITIMDGKIVSVMKTGQNASSKDDTVVDGRGKYAVPGFNNMHSHALIAKSPRLMLAAMLAEGTTGFRQMSASDEMLRDRREGRLPVDDTTPALLQMSGEILTPLNAFTPEQARATVKSQHEAGADFIKIIMMPPPSFFAAVETAHSLGLKTAGHVPAAVSLDQAIGAGFDSIEHFGTGNAIWVACAEAKAAEAKPGPSAPIAMARGTGFLLNPAAAEPEAAVRARQRLIDAFYEEACRKSAVTMQAKSVWQVPTLVRMRTQELADAPEYQTDPALANMSVEAITAWRESVEGFKSLPGTTRDTFRQSYALRLRIVSLWNAAGVSMMTGTDGKLEVPGQSLQQEFGELTKAGLPPLRILQMTTVDPARYLGRSDMGRIIAGAKADIVLLSDNPLTSAANLAKVEFVIRNGKPWSKAQLLKRVEQLRAAKNEPGACKTSGGDKCGR